MNSRSGSERIASATRARVDGTLAEFGTELAIELEAGTRKRATLNGVGLKRASDLMGRLPVVQNAVSGQVQDLVDSGIPGIHFYVLNKSPATAAVLSAVRLPGKR